MPVQLDLGTYTISVSTDGMNYRPLESAFTQFKVTIEKCPDGYTCEQETPTICPAGHFCPHGESQMFEPRQCPPGTYMTGTGAHECTPCSVDKFCPKIRLVYEEACPKGYLCPNQSSYTVREIQECPAGYICPDGTTSLSFTDLMSSNNMKACPNGYYCQKGVMQA